MHKRFIEGLYEIENEIYVCADDVDADIIIC